ncbi:T6SS effector BTH_I2691 family protein [Pseudoduganella umbonata]|uniref:Toxin VasX N-terminal region domain-containing protein n=1 Tax=Pseudoduganella umbonata TaxID=864828 RepID=A0A4P8HR21_9BURK|nr:T6SS effector BTH_I2691 family protein [Pseudoduganella umbonata]MBB3225236.1 hypothetical protein [Pseudoduganella umbonata]QCP12253.1 hypothetical protein FCL38_18885 [Pseudoduganella umbonata]
MTDSACSYCGRKGLLVYPVRYAVACPNGKDDVPGLSGNFKIAGGPDDISPAKYTLRALRTGYFYVYEEKRKRLKAYIVLPNGALWEFPVEYIPAIDTDRMDFCCLNRVSVSLSYCIDIEPFPCEVMGNIWMGWSNVLWTKSTISKVPDVKWRLKHLQCIDAQAMLHGSAAHSAKFKDYSSKVPHFSSSEEVLKKAFDFSNTLSQREKHLRDARGNIESVMQEKCPYGGFIVAVNDPVGITNDLSELTCPTHHSGFDETIYRGEICRQLLDNIEKSVRHDARTNAEMDIMLEKATEKDLRVAEADWGRQLWKVIKAGGPEKYEKRKQAERRRYGDSIEGRIAAAEDRAWKDFTSDTDGKTLFDSELLKNFPIHHEIATKKYESIGARLAIAHSAWLKCTQLRDWMHAVHDTCDIRSGFSYRESLAQCIGKGVATSQCEAILYQWLSSENLSDSDNLYVRALLFNQDELIDAAGVDIRGADYKPKYLLSVYKGALSRFNKKDNAHLVDRLVLTTANILARALGQAGSIVMRNLTLAGLTLLGKTLINRSNLTEKALVDWVIHQSNEQFGQFDKKFIGHLSNARKEAKRVIRRNPSHDVVFAFELDVKSLEKEGRIRAGTMRGVGIPGRDLIKEWFDSSDVNTGSVGVVLQLCALYYANEDFRRADEFDRTKLGLKVAVAVLAVAASTLEAVATTLDKVPDYPLSRFVMKHWNFGSGAIKNGVTIGKFFGAMAGAANAVFDFVNSYQAFKDGDKWLGRAYFLNGVLSLGLAIVGYFIGAAIFWPIFVLAFAFSLIVAAIRTPPLKRWVSRCYFSIQSGNDAKAYSSLEEELIAFNGAVGS